jgi:hypothetical protein
MVELESTQRIWQIAQEFLEQSSELDRVVILQIDRALIAIQGVGELLESPDVAVFPKYTLDGHVCENVHGPC